MLAGAKQHSVVTAHTAGLNVLVVEADDTDTFDLLEHLPCCLQFLSKALETGEGVLVHCAAGISRSATVKAPATCCTRVVSAMPR